MSQIIVGGGIAQAFYELAESQGCLSDKDKLELERLRGLPPNRKEEQGVMISYINRQGNRVFTLINNAHERSRIRT